MSLKTLLRVILVAAIGISGVPACSGADHQTEVANPEPEPPSVKIPVEPECVMTFAVVPDHNVAQVTGLEKAADDWNLLTWKHICLKYVSREEAVGITTNYIKFVPWDTMSKDGSVWGLHYSGSNVILLHDNLDMDLTRYVATHELGHALGIAHISGHGIMCNPTDKPCEQSLTIAADDIAACKAAGACL